MELVEEDAPVTNQDAEVVVQTTTDDLRATVQVFPPTGHGRPVTRDMVLDALSGKGIQSGIDSLEIDRVVAEQVYYQAVAVAKGTPPVDGQDARIIYHYGKNQLSGLQENQHGKVDFRELNQIINAKAGDLLVEKVPPVEGKPGTTVHGKAIAQAKGKDVRLRAGKDVTESDGGRKFYAKHDGQVIFRNYQVSIESTFKVAAVDASVGNIRFYGTVQVKGDIDDNYEVHATEGVVVGGTIGAAIVEAGGDVVVGEGVLKGRVTAGGMIRCKYAEEASLSAKNEITVVEYLKNCQTRSHDRVVVVNGNHAHGSIIGGTTTARREITANNVGSSAEIKTDARVGLDPDAVDRMAALLPDVEKGIRSFQEVAKNLQILQRARESAGSLDARKSELLKKLLQSGRETRDEMSAKVEELLRLSQAAMTEEKGKINVVNHTFPNAVIHVNNIPYQNKTLKTNCTYMLLDGEVAVIDLRKD